MILRAVLVSTIYFLIVFLPSTRFGETMAVSAEPKTNIKNEHSLSGDPQQDYRESRRRVWEAWQTYWKGDLQGALKLFKIEAEEHATAYYGASYTTRVLSKLPSYDMQLNELKNRRAKSAPQEQAEINRQIYTLSKEFYDRCGMATEASTSLYGPEYEEATKLLLYQDAEVTKGYLFQRYYSSDSCFMGKADKPIKALQEFMNRFPDSKYRKEIQQLLNDYQEGRMTCDGSRGSEN